MSSLEQIVRPFQIQNTAPASVVIPPGQVGQPLIRLSIGLRGGTKVFPYTGSCSLTTQLGAKHTEKTPTSAALQSAMAQQS